MIIVRHQKQKLTVLTSGFAVLEATAMLLMLVPMLLLMVEVAGRCLQSASVQSLLQDSVAAIDEPLFSGGSAESLNAEGLVSALDEQRRRISLKLRESHGASATVLTAFVGISFDPSNSVVADSPVFHGDTGGELQAALAVELSRVLEKRGRELRVGGPQMLGNHREVLDRTALIALAVQVQPRVSFLGGASRLAAPSIIRSKIWRPHRLF